VPTCIDFALECLVTGWTDGKVRCFDGETGQLLWELADVHKGGVSALAVSHNQRFLMTGGVEGSVRVWDIKSRELVSHMKEHLDAVTSIKIFDDDAHALSGSKDRNIICWDLKHEKRVASLRQRMGGVNCLCLYLDQVCCYGLHSFFFCNFAFLTQPPDISSLCLTPHAAPPAQNLKRDRVSRSVLRGPAKVPMCT
jgi:WD40 repeat protein